MHFSVLSKTTQFGGDLTPMQEILRIFLALQTGRCNYIGHCNSVAPSMNLNKCYISEPKYERNHIVQIQDGPSCFLIHLLWSARFSIAARNEK